MVEVHYPHMGLTMDVDKAVELADMAQTLGRKKHHDEHP